MGIINEVNMARIVNAKITNVSISMDDHACLTFTITLNGGAWACNYGGYCIGNGCLDGELFTAETGNGLVAMMKIMDAVGVERWEDLKGKYVRVIDNGGSSRITKIGNIILNKWFDIDYFFKNYGKDTYDEDYCCREQTVY